MSVDNLARRYPDTVSPTPTPQTTTTHDIVSAIVPTVRELVDLRKLLMLTRSAQEVDGILDASSVEKTEETMHQEYLDLVQTNRTSREGTGRRRTGNRVDDINFHYRSTRQIRLDNAKRVTQWELPTLGDQIHGYTNTGTYIGNSNPRKPFQRKTADDRPVRVTGDNDGATIRKCIVLDCPIRRWENACIKMQASGHSRRDFVNV